MTTSHTDLKHSERSPTNPNCDNQNRASLSRTHHGLRKASIIAVASLSALAFTACSDNNSANAEDTASTAMSSASSAASGAKAATAGSSTGSSAFERSTRNSANTAASGNQNSGETKAEAQGSNQNAANGSKSSDTSADDGSSGSKTMADDFLAALTGGIDVGGTLMARGEEMTACTVGDGFALHIVAAGPNTSCEFARVVENAQTAGLNATEDNVRDHLQPNITVSSPVTGKTYNMSCSTASDKVISCSGGNDATVYMY